MENTDGSHQLPASGGTRGSHHRSKLRIVGEMTKCLFFSFNYNINRVERISSGHLEVSLKV